VNVHLPVGLRLKVLDLELSVADKAKGHGLDTPGGETLEPPAGQHPGEERTYLIAHQPVQDPAGPLGLHLSDVHLARLLQGPPHCLRSDLVEEHPREPVLRPVGEELHKVVGDGLTLPVGVGGQVHLGRVPHRLAQGGHELAVPYHPLGTEAVLNVHPELLLREIPDMALGGMDLETTA